FRSNKALGGHGGSGGFGSGSGGPGGNGGSASGGGLFLNYATLSLADDQIQNNLVIGGTAGDGTANFGGGRGGDSRGGGLYVNNGSLTESGSLLVQGNAAGGAGFFRTRGGLGGNARGGQGGNGGDAFGGGMYATGAAIKITSSALFELNT